MPLKRDYFKCLSITKNTKQNGDPYLFIKLQNSKEIVDGYLWKKIELYQKRILKDGLYAIKYQEEMYNDSKVLNIKNINSIKDDRYKKYGYSSNSVLINSKVINNNFFNEISNFILKRDDPLMNILFTFMKKNKKVILSSKYIQHKYLCLKYFQLIESALHREIDSNLYIYIILIDRLDLDINPLILKIKKYSDILYEALYLYSNNNKGFIKKYKSIVDLINDNLNNYTNLKIQPNGRDAKK